MVSVQLIALSLVRTAVPSGSNSLVTQFIKQFDSTEPIWSIDPIYIAMVGALIILAQLYREGKRQGDTIRKLAGASSGDRPDLSPGQLRYITTRRVDAHCIVAILVRIAAKGYVTLRLSGNKLELRKVENPANNPLSSEEGLLLNVLMKKRNYIEITTLWYAMATAAISAVKGSFGRQFGEEYITANSSMKWFVVTVFSGVFFAFSFTTLNPVQTLVYLLFFIPFVGVCYLMVRVPITQFFAVSRSRPTLREFLRAPSRKKIIEIIDFFAMLGEMVFTIDPGVGFFVFCIAVCVLGFVIGLFGFWSTIILLVTAGVVRANWQIVRYHPTLKGYELMGKSERYKEVFDASMGHDAANGWADTVALGHLNAVGDMLKLLETESPPYIPTEVPAWFTHSEEKPTVRDLVKVLGGKLPLAINDALSQENRK